MFKTSAQVAISVALAANLTITQAAAPAIGVALTSGNVTINNARAEGNASIFDGSTVATGTSASRIQLKSGANVQLAVDSRGKFYQDRVVLEKGNTQVQAAKPFEVDTDVVKIMGAANSSAQISLRGQTVQVASLSGTLKVANASGVFVTTIAPGMSYDFSAAEADMPGGQPPADPNAPANNNNKKKKAGGAILGSGGAHAAGMVIAGVVVVGAAVGVATYYGTQGSTTPQACLSPCQTH